MRPFSQPRTNCGLRYASTILGVILRLSNLSTNGGYHTNFLNAAAVLKLNIPCFFRAFYSVLLVVASSKFLRMTLCSAYLHPISHNSQIINTEKANKSQYVHCYLKGILNNLTSCIEGDTRQIIVTVCTPIDVRVEANQALPRPRSQNFLDRTADLKLMVVAGAQTNLKNLVVFATSVCAKAKARRWIKL